MDVFERLRKDHRYQEDLLKQIADTNGDTKLRRELFRTLKREATAHANAEEQTLYAELLEHSVTQEQARHSVAEHQSADELLDELTELGTGSGGWLAKFSVLKRELEHHIDEEEDDVFPIARKLLDEADTTRLGEKFERRKQSELEEMGVAHPQTGEQENGDDR